MQATFVSVPYRPSTPLSGNEAPCIFRGKNMLLRGQVASGQMLYSAYRGSRNLSEVLPTQALTGTISFSPASHTVSGAGTLFQDELHLGQRIIAGDDVLVVRSIQSQTSFTSWRLPSTTDSTSAYKVPGLFALDIKRGSLYFGNACLTDKGNIVAVGDGELLVNGSALSASLTATRRAQIALYDSTTNTYSIEDLGFDNVPNIVHADITVVASGGTKNTSAGYYSFMLAYYSDITTGFGNPTGVLLSGGTAGYQITTANSTFRIDKSGDSPPSKATGYIIYATAFGGSSAQSAVNAIEGPWQELKRVPFTDFTADAYSFDYVDSDLSTTFADLFNDTPPDAEFLSLFTGYITLVSTNGAGVNTTGRELETSPGPFLSPMKGDNIDGYPASLRTPTAEGETILGFVSAAGRLFPMTPNTLQAATPTGLPQSPFTLRPFWQRGFATPYNLTFIDDTLYGFTANGPYRSIATGDGNDASNDFAQSVDQQMSSWNAGDVLVDVDPKNVCVCYFNSAAYLNDAGYWVTEVYLYSLRINDWLPPVVLTSDTRDLIVTGTARVQNSLYFVAGGRRQSASVQFDTFEFDGGSSEDVPYYLGSNFSDYGAEMVSKIVHKLRPKGRFHDATLQVYGVTPDSDIDITDFENGDNPVFEYALDDTDAIKQYQVEKVRCRNMLMWALRLEGTSNYGTNGAADQFEEVATDYSVTGQLR